MTDIGLYGYEFSEPDDDGVRDVLVIRRSDRKAIERCWTIRDALALIDRLESGSNPPPQISGGLSTVKHEPFQPTDSGEAS